ncbi:hypothetical protein BKA62DRAFT_671181 [Auriculariales sp. MPI-PUGE-AT-0066]|nr:hypothetical protein BKA62DRAFT_671181 [Auriculariales sp. MPI-PUGE-AT-0066]
MGVPVASLLLFALLAQVYAGANDNALSIGNSNWGFNVFITNPPRECAPLQIWYNVSNAVSTIPDWTSLPNDARVEFLTPESAEDVWMTLRPTMGTGTLTWTVPLRQGKQFVVRNSQGYKQVLTVGSPTDATSCGQDAAQVTGTSNFGELQMAVFNRLRNNTYASYSVTPSDQFRPTKFPTTSVTNHAVSLGAAVPDTITPDPSTTSSPPAENTGNSGNSNELAPGESTSATSPSSGSSEPSSTPAPSTGGLSGTTRGTVTTPGFSATTPVAQQGVESTIPGGSSASGPDGNSPSDQLNNGSENDKSNSGTNIGAIVGGILGALLVGALLGGFCVWLQRRRRRQRRQARPLDVTPLQPPMQETTESIAATGGNFSVLPIYAGATDFSSDRKHALLDDDLAGTSHRDSLGTTTAVWTNERRSFFGGMSDYPATADHSSRADSSSDAATVINLRANPPPPPKYSRFA